MYLLTNILSPSLDIAVVAIPLLVEEKRNAAKAPARTIPKAFELLNIPPSITKISEDSERVNNGRRINTGHRKFIKIQFMKNTGVLNNMRISLNMYDFTAELRLDILPICCELIFVFLDDDPETPVTPLK
jgi:hypothetical protein